MTKPKIVSEIRINGKWVNQDDIPSEVVQTIVENVLKRAGANVGFDVVANKKRA